MAELTPEQDGDFNIRVAERTHDQVSADTAARGDMVVKDAWGVIRNLTLINGGAAISILTFVGALATKVNPQPSQIAEIGKGVKFFAVGVFAATVTSALSYLTNSFYLCALSNYSKDYVHPYVHATPVSTVRHYRKDIPLASCGIRHCVFGLLSFGVVWLSLVLW
jgi:hypothetical protein